MLRILWIAIVFLHCLITETYSSGICHYFSDVKMDWFDALFECQQRGFCLADMSTKRTIESFYDEVKDPAKVDIYFRDYWFGLTNYEQNVFTYVSNHQTVKYIPPDSQLLPKGYCAFLKPAHRTYTFNSASCGLRKRFICSDSAYCNGVKTNSSYVAGYSLKPQCEISSEIREILGIQ